MANIIYPIQPMELTQGFGVNEPAYRRFGLKGHNGWDFRTKFADTPQGHRYIYSSFNAKLITRGNEGNDGFGIYFDVSIQLKSLWKLTFAHCLVHPEKNEFQAGDIMTVSDNTGNSTGSHLHLTTKRITIENGKIVVSNYNNGYFGAVNPQEFFDELRQFQGAGTVSMPTSNPYTYDQLIIDGYQAICRRFPSDDEKQARRDQFAKGMNAVQFLESLMGDGAAVSYWKIGEEPPKPVENPIDKQKLIDILTTMTDDAQSLVLDIQSIKNLL